MNETEHPEPIEEDEAPAPDVEVAPAAPPSEPEPEAALLEAEAPDAVLDKLEHLEKLIRDGFAANEKRERILDDLHRENQKHKQNLLLSVMDPIFKSLVRLHDDMLDTMERARSDKTKMTRQKILDDMKFYWEEIVETLARQGVSSFRDEPGVPFDARRHQIVKTAPTHDPAQNGLVVEVVRSGFALYEDSGGSSPPTKTIRPQLVVVGKYQPPADVERKENDNPAEEP